VRNSKVRQRIAAGKLHLRIRDLRNLGVKTEEQLAQIGIHRVAQLRARGAVQTYVDLKRAGIVSSLNALWALSGAMEPWPEGRHWREVARGDARLSLLLAVEDAEADQKAAGVERVVEEPEPESDADPEELEA
jgi:DNA transformation protein